MDNTELKELTRQNYVDRIEKEKGLDGRIVLAEEYLTKEDKNDPEFLFYVQHCLYLNSPGNENEEERLSSLIEAAEKFANMHDPEGAEGNREEVNRKKVKEYRKKIALILSNEAKEDRKKTDYLITYLELSGDADDVEAWKSYRKAKEEWAEAASHSRNYMKNKKVQEYHLVPLAEEVLEKIEEKEGKGGKFSVDDLVQEPLYYYANVIIAGKLLEEKRYEEAQIALEKALEQAQSQESEKNKKKVEQDCDLIKRALIGIYKTLARSRPKSANQYYLKVGEIDQNEPEAFIHLTRVYWRERGKKNEKTTKIKLSPEVWKRCSDLGDRAAWLFNNYKAKGTKDEFFNEEYDNNDEICRLIIKMDEARRDKVKLDTSRRRVKHFGYDPLAIPVPKDSLFIRIKEEISSLAG